MRYIWPGEMADRRPFIRLDPWNSPMDVTYRFDPYRPIELTSPRDADEAVEALASGNERFTDFIGKMRSATLGEEPAEQIVLPIDLVSMGVSLMPDVALEQRPYAIVLGCSDARAPIERIFDQSFNNLFVVRIAGNVLGTECLGSLDYAVRSFKNSVRLIVVLGHSGCGAVTAAVEGYLNPSCYSEIAFTHALRSLVDRIMIAVRVAASGFSGRVPKSGRAYQAYRQALIDSSVYLNAAITAYDLKREAQSLGAKDIEIMYGVCDLGSLKVHGHPPKTGAKGRGKPKVLAKPPKQAEDFADLAKDLAETLWVK